MLARHVPARFAGKRHAWFFRMSVVAARKAAKAEAEGRTAWANLWRNTSYSAREGYHETRPEY